jgi:Arc/MetJ-type ribon-helix-helix transcriptional regulator
MQSVVKTVKLPKPLAAALARAARARECSESDLIREGIQRVLETDEGVDMVTAIGADVGVGRGPRDLSSNRGRLSGYGRSRHR